MLHTLNAVMRAQSKYNPMTLEDLTKCNVGQDHVFAMSCLADWKANKQIKHSRDWAQDIDIKPQHHYKEILRDGTMQKITVTNKFTVALEFILKIK